MHPSKFFNECFCRVGFDVVEIYNEDLREKLMNTHPKNFLVNTIRLPVQEIEISYYTNQGNYKRAKRYAVLDNSVGEEYIDFLLDMNIREYNTANPNHQMLNCKIINMAPICTAVLSIG